MGMPLPSGASQMSAGHALFTVVITESLRLERTSKITKSNHPPPRLLNHVPKCHVYTVFEPLQGWGAHHCPGQPGPVLHNSFGEEIFPDIRSEPPLVQLEAVSSCPVAGYLGAETNPRLTTTSCQGAAEGYRGTGPFLKR